MVAVQDGDAGELAMMSRCRLHQASIANDFDTELNIVQAGVYFIAPEGRRSRRRPGTHRHTLRPLREVGAMDGTWSSS